MQVGKCKKDTPPKCAGGFTSCLLIRARAIFFFRQEKRQLLCQKQNKGHSGHCRPPFVPDGRRVVSIGCAGTRQSNGQHWDLSVLSDTLLSKMLPLLFGHRSWQWQLELLQVLCGKRAGFTLPVRYASFPMTFIFTEPFSHTFSKIQMYPSSWGKIKTFPRFVTWIWVDVRAAPFNQTTEAINIVCYTMSG